MVQLWNLYLPQPLLIFLFVLLKINFEFLVMILSACFNEIFPLFSFPDCTDKVKRYLSSKHPDINCSLDKEKDER